MEAQCQLIYSITPPSSTLEYNLIFNCHRALADILNDEVHGGTFGRMTRVDTAQQEHKLSLTHAPWRLQCGISHFLPRKQLLLSHCKNSRRYTFLLFLMKYKEQAEGYLLHSIDTHACVSMHTHRHTQFLSYRKRQFNFGQSLKCLHWTYQTK